MGPEHLLALYCAAIAVASLVGIHLQARVHFGHTALQIVMSFIAGLVLGVAVQHLLPHSVERISGPSPMHSAAGWMMLGMALTVLLLRMSPFHRHENDVPSGEAQTGGGGFRVSESGPAWAGVAAGMTLHSLAEGATLAASIRSGSAPWMSVGIFLAIALHKPLDAFSVLRVMACAEVGRGAALAIKVALALACPMAAIGAYNGSGLLGPAEGEVTGRALAFGAGVLVCIALSDLLPEIHFHTHDRGWLAAAFVGGVAVAHALHLLEVAPLWTAVHGWRWEIAWSGASGCG